MAALIIIALLAALALIGVRIIYGLSFKMTPEKHGEAHDISNGEQYRPYREKALGLVDKALAEKYEPVYIKSFDGLKLFGKLYLKDPTAPFELMMHGYHGVAERDFCGGLNLALESGMNVLLIDERAHGKSEGKALTMGVLERLDCKSWAEYIAGRFENSKIILVGISMGAATVLMASELELPENVMGIIADCPYSSPEKIIKKEIEKMGFPPRLTYPIARMAGRIFAHFDIEACSAEEAVSRTRLPILLIHGEDDRFVPCCMSHEIYEACASDKKLLTVPGAGHGLSYMLDYEAYAAAVNDFIYKTTGFKK